MVFYCCRETTYNRVHKYLYMYIHTIYIYIDVHTVTEYLWTFSGVRQSFKFKTTICVASDLMSKNKWKKTDDSFWWMLVHKNIHFISVQVNFYYLASRMRLIWTPYIVPIYTYIYIHTLCDRAFVWICHQQNRCSQCVYLLFGPESVIWVEKLFTTSIALNSLQNHTNQTAAKTTTTHADNEATRRWYG